MKPAPPPITASANIQLSPMVVAPAGPPHTYLGMARAFLSGAQTLAADPKASAISLAFLAAQATECALKAYLSKSGNDTRLKSRLLRHDLLALWSLAAAEGLTASATPPTWLGTLSHLHASP